jgi:hypothetical protein
MRKLVLITALLLLGVGTFGQKKMSGIGGEVSALSLKPTARWWVSKNTGFDVFAGVSAEFEDFKPNDYEAGAKYLRSFIFRRTDRTYFGLMGKWKRLKLQETSNTTSLPVFGVLIGKEWFTKRAHKKGFAVEIGYQYGTTQYNVYNLPKYIKIGKGTYTEFPLLLNIRYALYKDR